MGNTLSAELASNDFGIDLTNAITIQLRNNHYPPVPHSMVPVCIEAIEAYNEGDYYREIELPEGVSWRGNLHAPANQIIMSHHLEAWCEDEYE